MTFKLRSSAITQQFSAARDEIYRHGDLSIETTTRKKTSNNTEFAVRDTPLRIICFFFQYKSFKCILISDTYHFKSLRNQTFQEWIILN